MRLTTIAGAWMLRLMFRLFPSTPKALTFSGGEIEPTRLTIPTRHGDVCCWVYQSIANQASTDRPPVYINLHGGAFIVRSPRQDDHVCRFIAAQTSAVVVSVDYATAPDAQYPVAEHQAGDVFNWISRHGDSFGWDTRRMAVGGFSAGAKLAINVCQQLRDGGAAMALALVAGYPALNMTLAPAARHSVAPIGGASPAVAPWLIKLMYDSYFEDQARRGEILASPELDEDLRLFPPTLLLIGGLDTLAAEADRFAQSLSAAGVSVRSRRFEGSDHGLTHNLPVDVAREALDLIVAHLRRVFRS